MSLREHTYEVRCVVVIDEIRICSCSDDKTIKVWNISTRECERTIKQLKVYDRVYSLVVLSDGRICSVSDQGGLRIWNVESGVCEFETQICTDSLEKVIQLQDGRLVVSTLNRDVYIVG